MKFTHALLALSAVPLVALGGACKEKVEVKQDSPQAAMASLIKVYEAERGDLLESVVDPALLKMDARTSACSAVAVAQEKCVTDNLEHYMRRNPYTDYKKPVECPKASECFCKEKGNDAVSKMTPYADSVIHRGLLAAGFKAEACEIVDASPIEDPQRLTSLLPFFDLAACSDVNSGDAYASVQVKCGEPPRKMTFVFRQSGGAWRLIGLEKMTKLELVMNAPAKVDASEKQRREELNKGLKK